MKLLAIFLSTWLIPTICHAVCFTSYWGIDTSQCAQFLMHFDEISCDYGIRNNAYESTNGDQIVILHRPGIYPYVKVDSNGSIQQINGGVPQNVNMQEHLEKLEADIDRLVDEDFAGICIIKLLSDDGVMWRLLQDSPGDMRYYSPISYSLTNSSLNEDERKKLAKSQYEDAARTYMEKTIRRAKELRPNAIWGFDDLPNCFQASMATNSSCSGEDQASNDRMEWFWKLQDYMMPYIYIHDAKNVDDALKRSGTRITETKRLVSKHNLHSKIIPRLDINRRGGTDYLDKEVVSAVLRNMIDHDVDGVLLYDSSLKLDSAAACQGIRDHMKNVLGPQIKKDMDYAKLNGGCVNSTYECSDLPGSIA